MSGPSRRPASTSTPSITSASKHSQQSVPFYRRLLFPHLPPNAALPPLLASPSVTPELTHDLYEFIALSLRAFVHPWWSKITRYDKELLPAITRTLAVFLRALEARVVAVDLSPLIFRDIPSLIIQHYKDYRNAQAKLSTSYATGGAADLPQLFHNLQPHMAISADGRLEEEYFRQIADHILKCCLPPEDYEAEAERYIIREIMLKILLKDILLSVTQPWYICSVLLDLIGAEEDISLPKNVTGSPASRLPDSLTAPSNTTVRASSPTPSPFSFHTLLVAFLSAIQMLSGACLAVIHAYKHALNTIKLVNQAPAVPHLAPPSRPARSTSRRSVSLPVLHQPTTSNQKPSSPSISVSSHVPSSATPNESHNNILSPMSQIPKDIAYLPLMMVSEILTMTERFSSAVIMHTLLMFSSTIGPFLDRLLLYLLTTTLSTSLITHTVRIAKCTYFPNGYASTPPPDPTAEEQAAMRERLVRWTPHGLLAHLVPLILGPRKEYTLSTALDPLSSAPCNLHLAVLILDRLTLALFPELGTHP